MKILDLLWWFFDLDKSSGSIGKSAKSQKNPMQQHNEPGEAIIDNVEAGSDDFFEFEEFDG